MEIKKTNGKHEIRIQPLEYEGKARIDVRLWVWAEDLQKRIPTKRGLSVRLDQVDEIVCDIRQAEKALQSL